MSGGILHMPAPGSGRCLSGRPISGGGHNLRGKVPPCPRKALRDGSYCQEHLEEAWARVPALVALRAISGDAVR